MSLARPLRGDGRDSSRIAKKLVLQRSADLSESLEAGVDSVSSQSHSHSFDAARNIHCPEPVIRDRLPLDRTVKCGAERCDAIKCWWNSKAQLRSHDERSRSAF